MDITYAPIFNQAIPGVWAKFADICSSTMLTNYNYKREPYEIAADIENDSKSWRRGIHFAFGAYSDNEMIGFIQGDARGRCATIQSLYVLKDYQRVHAGRSLLSRAERAVSVFANRVELVSLAKAEPFYQGCGYSSQYGTNRYEKTRISAPQCECVPVFKCSRALENKCRRLNPDFNADLVNKLHVPMFAYFDVDFNLSGYAIGNATDDSISMVGALSRVTTAVLRGSIERYLAACNVLER